MEKKPTIQEIVEKILWNAGFWAPEVRVAKLCDYLEAHGEPLYAALRALPEEQRKRCGVDEVHRTGGGAS